MSRRFTFLLFSTLSSFFLFFIVVHADTATYQALAPLQTPNNTEVGTGANLGAYFSQMYQIGVGVATALAVLMVIWGGVEYVTTDAIGGKEEGKQKVQNAILGLLLALGSYLILQTINPALLNTNLQIQTVQPPGSGVGQINAAPVSQPGGGNQNPTSGGDSSFNNWTSADDTNLDGAYSHYDSNGNAIDPSSMNPAEMKAAGLTDSEINTMVKLQTDTQLQNVYYASNPFVNTGGVNGSSSLNVTADGSPFSPNLTAYSPQSGGSTMEGGLESSVPGPDGQSIVRTLDDVANGRSPYVSLAGDPSQYGQYYVIPSITYTNSNGQNVTLTNVTGVVMDTGSAFTGAGTSHFDVPIGVNYNNSLINSQPFTGGNTSIVHAKK